jgi:ribosomal protein L37E
MAMTRCRECGREVSDQALACPTCGVPSPGRDRRDGWGYEYRSRLALFGLPLLHVSFKYRSNQTPVFARGVVAIGQFACGVVTVSQFGLGVFSLGQFVIGGWVLAQFAVGGALIAQFGAYLREGWGQHVTSIGQWLGLS